jgi:hypothetical protein
VQAPRQATATILWRRRRGYVVLVETAATEKLECAVFKASQRSQLVPIFEHHDHHDSRQTAARGGHCVRQRCFVQPKTWGIHDAERNRKNKIIYASPYTVSHNVHGHISYATVTGGKQAPF